MEYLLENILNMVGFLVGLCIGTCIVSNCCNLPCGAKSDRGFVLLAMGSIVRCKKLYSEISKEVIACTAPPHRDVAKKFGILKKEETSCDGSLEDVLAERAAVLV